MVMLPGLGPTALDDLATALEAGRLRAPYTPSAVRRHVPETAVDDVVRELSTIHSQSFTAPQTALLLRTLARERRHHQQTTERTELVWSGPDAPGTSPRDTAVVIRGLCSAARRSVLIANYSFDRARDGDALQRARSLWQPLADAMDRYPDLRVRRAILHAKCVIIDDTQVFLTSANFTQAGQQRNLEAGLLLQNPTLARDLTAQFDALAHASALLQIHGGDPHR